MRKSPYIYGNVELDNGLRTELEALASMSNDDIRKITVLLNLEEYNRFSEYCKSTGHKKSTLIARLIKEHLDREGFGPEDRSLPLFNVEDGRRSR